MALKRLLKRLASLALRGGGPVTMPHGLSVYHDIRRLLPRYAADIVFDIGANDGQSTLGHFVNWFPNATIVCFEPVGATYDCLVRATRHIPRISCERLGMGAASGIRRMHLAGPSDQFSLQDPSLRLPKSQSIPTEEVVIGTVDAYCRDRGIQHIGFMKVDTEGGDLEVLEGASDMIARHSIDIIQVEAGMNPHNHRHVPFSDFVSHLGRNGYLLLGIYNQFHEKPTGSPVLRRCDPAFISPALVKRFTLASLNRTSDEKTPI